MSKTFIYTKITNSYYSPYTDSNECDGEDFEYEVSSDKLLKAVSELLFYDYFSDDKGVCASKELTEQVKRKLKDLVDENDLLDGFVETYENELKEYFEEEAFENYGG